MKKAIMFNLFIMVFVGCQQPTANFMWVKKELADMPREEGERLWSKDIKDCQYQVEVECMGKYPIDSSGISNPLIMAEVKPKLFKMCMEAKGYRMVPVGTPPEEW